MHVSSGVFALALALTATTVTAQRVVSLGISKVKKGAALQRRVSTYAATISNNLTLGGYVATCQVGTPPQTIMLAVDTGSSDVWMLSTSTDLCTSRHLQEEYGQCITLFDPSQSSTYKLISTNTFQAKYADQSEVIGNYISDSFNIGGAGFNAFQMGLATESTLSQGLLGLGFDADESTTTDSTYPNLVDVMQSSGRIGVKAFSLYLVKWN